MSLDTIPTTDLFDAFTKTLCVGYDYVGFTLDFSGGSRVLLAPWLLTPSMASLEDLLSLFSTLSKAHRGYLHLVRAFLRCSFSCLSNSGLLLTVFGPMGEGVGNTKLGQRGYGGYPIVSTGLYEFVSCTQ